MGRRAGARWMGGGSGLGTGSRSGGTLLGCEGGSRGDSRARRGGDRVVLLSSTRGRPHSPQKTCREEGCRNARGIAGRVGRGPARVGHYHSFTSARGRRGPAREEKYWGGIAPADHFSSLVRATRNEYIYRRWVIPDRGPPRGGLWSPPAVANIEKTPARMRSKTRANLQCPPTMFHVRSTGL